MATDDPLIAVLAGGASRRMGTDKALMPLAGRPMAAWVLDAAAPLGEVVVIGRSDSLLGVDALPDAVAGAPGPAAGLATALSAAEGRPVILLACDQPWVRRGTLLRLLSLFDGTAPVMPHDGGALQVTCAIYPASLASEADAAARAQRSIRSMLKPSAVEPDTWQSWGEDGRSWFSVDTPAAMDAGLDRFGPP